MGSRKRGSKIKKSRLMLILKSRGIKLKTLARDIEYNYSALSRAINSEYLDNQTLDDICEYLDVSASFLDGSYPLRRLKPEYRGHAADYGVDPSGYDIPPYFADKEPYIDTKRGAWHDVYRDFIISLGKIGVLQSLGDEDRIYYDSDFVMENSSYLVPPIRAAAIETIKSAYYQDENYLAWADDKHDIENALSEMSLIDYFDMFDVIEEARRLNLPAEDDDFPKLPIYHSHFGGEDDGGDE